MRLVGMLNHHLGVLLCRNEKLTHNIPASKSGGVPIDRPFFSLPGLVLDGGRHLWGLALAGTHRAPALSFRGPWVISSGVLILQPRCQLSLGDLVACLLHSAKRVRVGQVRRLQPALEGMAAIVAAADFAAVDVALVRTRLWR